MNISVKLNFLLLSIVILCDIEAKDTNEEDSKSNEVCETEFCENDITWETEKFSSQFRSKTNL